MWCLARPRWHAGTLVASSLAAAAFVVGTIAEAQPPAVVRLAVPYHSQIPPLDPSLPGNWPWTEPGNANIPNGFCTCACLEMLFGYSENLNHNNPPLPQQEIAAVANTNDAMGLDGHWGTWLSDARRAAHFSSATPAWPTPAPPYVPAGATGYTWRALGPATNTDYGCVAIDGNWTANGWTMAQFKAVLAAWPRGYPLMINVNADSVMAHPPVEDPEDSDADASGVTSLDETAVGHSIVVRGYDDNRNMFLIHCPTLGPGLMVNQQTLWNAWWTSKDFLFVAPWGTSIVVPALGNLVPQPFQTSAAATYTDVLPVAGTGRNVASSGVLIFQVPPLVAALAQGQPGTIAFAQVVSSGQTQQSAWNCVTTAIGQCQATAETWGSVQAFAQSFPGGYTDDLGSWATTNVVVPPLIATADPGICHIPRIRWWEGGHFGLDHWLFGVPAPLQMTATVENHGTATASNVLVRFFRQEPSLIQRYPSSSLVPVGSTTVPSIPAGGEVTTSPVTFTLPPANSFGQPYWGFVATTTCAPDGPDGTWVEFDNDIASRMRMSTPVIPFTGYLATAWIGNPDTVPRWVVTRFEAELPSGWAAGVIPAGVDSVLMAPSQTEPRSMYVDVGSPGTGEVELCEDLYAVDGSFVQRTGGVCWNLSTEEVDAPLVTSATALRLDPPSPNPMTDAVRIAFALPAAASVDVAVFDVAGRRVATLYRGEALPGSTSLPWGGLDARGRHVAAGAYFVRLVAAGETRTQSLVVIR